MLSTGIESAALLAGLLAELLAGLLAELLAELGVEREAIEVIALKTTATYML